MRPILNDSKYLEIFVTLVSIIADVYINFIKQYRKENA